MKQEIYPLVVPSLMFNGQGKEAIELYKKVFNAEIGEKILFSEADPEDFICENESQKDFVYYCELMIGSHMIMVSDSGDGMLDGQANRRKAMTALCVSFDSEEKARNAYEILSDGAEILMPISSTSFCTFYATLEDKFGIVWDLYFGDA